MRLKIVFIILLNLVVASCYSQIYSRIEADFSLKEKRFDGSKSLTMGRVYYDTKALQVVFDIKFPEKMLIILNDTAIIQIKQNQIVNVTKAFGAVKFSVFSLCLEGNLKEFGLNDTPYDVTNVEKDNGMVISTWESAEVEGMGKILLSQKERKLFGMITYTNEDVLISKQFFEDYKSIEGLEFPGKVVQFLYNDDQESVKITSFENVVVNEESNEEYYFYPVPFLN
jgi:hypothetical protein